MCLRLSGFWGVLNGKAAREGVSLIRERRAVVCQSAHWFSLQLMKSFIAQLNLFQNLPREKLILLCITLLGAKATKTYLASFQGEKCMVYKADLTVRRPEHSLKIPCYCFNFLELIRSYTTSKRRIAKIFQTPSWKHGHSSPKGGFSSVYIYNLSSQTYCKIL